jgi:hypothetical protein
MDFEEYLNSKNIDSKAFMATEPEMWQQWASLFEQVHPNSFTEQKKFLLNSIRRRFLLNRDTPATVMPVTAVPETETQPKPVVRKAPVIKRRTDS